MPSEIEEEKLRLLRESFARLLQAMNSQHSRLADMFELCYEQLVPSDQIGRAHV